MINFRNSSRLLALIFLSGFASGKSWSAERIIHSGQLKSLILESNPRVQASFQHQEAAKEREGYLLRSFLPNFEAFAAEESFRKGRGSQLQQPAFGAELTFNVYNGGRDFLEDRFRVLNSDRAQFASQRNQMEELEKARVEYWQWLYQKERVLLVKKTLEVNQQNLASANRRIRSGVATDSDRMEFEMKAVDLERDLQMSLYSEKAHERNLKVLLGAAASDKLRSEETLNHDHEFQKDLQHSSKDHDFLYKETEILGLQNEVLAKKHSREWIPSVEVYAGYNQFNEREEEFPAAEDRRESVFGVRMKMGISAGLEAMYEGRALQKESQAAKALVRFQQAEIETHLANELEELQLLHDQIHDAEENILRAERYYRATQAEYGRGVKNSPDVLGASEKLFEARDRKLEIVRDFQIAKSHVLSKIGK